MDVVDEEVARDEGWDGGEGFGGEGFFVVGADLEGAGVGGLEGGGVLDCVCVDVVDAVRVVLAGCGEGGVECAVGGC